MNKYRNHWWRHSATKVFLLILICVLPLNIFAIISLVFMMNNSKENLKLSMENVAAVYMNSLDNERNNISYLLYDLCYSDPDVLEVLYAASDSAYINARYRAIIKMRDEVHLQVEGDVLFIISSDRQDVLMAVDSEYRSKENAIMELLQSDEFRENYLRWGLVDIEGQTWLANINKRKEDYYGALICLDNYMNQTLSSIEYDTAEVWFSEGIQEPESSKTAIFVADKDNRLYLNIQVDNGEIYGNISLLTWVMTVLAIFFLCLIPILYLTLRRTILNPLKVLNRAHLKFGEDVSFRIKEHADTIEMEDAYWSFNEMACGIQTLRIENMQKELDKNKMELENLQLQIQPHFLLNTFNMIYVLTERENYEAIRELVLYLSEYFRYLYRSEGHLQLFDKEFNLIQGYIKAAKMRFPNRIHISYQIDPEIYFMRLPPLLLHNFIENIIKHGMVDGKAINIILFAGYSDKTVTIQINDDGVGMDESLVQEINESSGKADKIDKTDHLGIRNSIRRLHYFYGEDASLRVDSIRGQGTTVEIIISYDLDIDIDHMEMQENEGEEHDEIINGE